MIKRSIVCVFLFWVLTCNPAYAWIIKNYDIEINLAKDSRFTVTETIEADFYFENKHGIYRDIPTTYADEKGQPYTVNFEVLSVRDRNQQTWPFREENFGHFKRIKIGSPSQTISGTQTYIIRYRVNGAILFLNDHDELYWNATGTQWDVRMNHVHVAVHLPEAVSKELVRTTSYTGANGLRTTRAQSEIVNDSLVTFDGENFNPREGLTIVVGLPKDILTHPFASAPVDLNRTDALPFVSVAAETTPDNNSSGWGYLFLPVLVFFIMLNVWKTFGKDPILEKSIVVEYKAPNGLKPAEMGTLIDSNVDQRDMTSVIIDLAVRGYIKIVQKKGLLWAKNYALVLLKKYEDIEPLIPYEKSIIFAIFGRGVTASEVLMSDLSNKFYLEVSPISNQIKDELRSRHYMEKDNDNVLMGYLFLAGFVFLGGIMFIDNLWIMSAVMLSGVIIFLFGLLMPKRTVEGTEMLSKILGFKEFLVRTEKDKIQKAEQQDIFERMLPYAICLGISTQWAKKFDGIYTQPPHWFAGEYGQVFYYDHFIHDLDRSINSMGTTFYSSPQTVSSSGGFSGGGSFGGGGSSGGGFGGGGGGSW